MDFHWILLMPYKSFQMNFHNFGLFSSIEYLFNKVIIILCVDFIRGRKLLDVLDNFCEIFDTFCEIFALRTLFELIAEVWIIELLKG